MPTLGRPASGPIPPPPSCGAAAGLGRSGWGGMRVRIEPGGAACRAGLRYS